MGPKTQRLEVVSGPWEFLSEFSLPQANPIDLYQLHRTHYRYSIPGLYVQLCTHGTAPVLRVHPSTKGYSPSMSSCQGYFMIESSEYPLYGKRLRNPGAFDPG